MRRWKARKPASVSAERELREFDLGRIGSLATSEDPNLQADPRWAFLLRASVKFDLVEAGLQDIDDAVADLVHAAHQMAPRLDTMAALSAATANSVSSGCGIGGAGEARRQSRSP